MEPTAIETGRHVRALDGLRGLAVLAVMLYHFHVPLAQHGFIGVDVFFVLSGYLITSIIVREWHKAGTIRLRRFYTRRGLRLLPAFWLMLIVLIPLTPPQDLVSAGTYTIDWTMGLHLRGVNSMLGHTWSLAAEMQFYLVWPAILILALMRFNPRTVAVFALALGLASAAWRATVWQLDPDWFRVFVSPDTHADGLLIGSALGLAATLARRPLSARISHALWAATGLSLLLVAGLVIIPPLPWGFFATAGDLFAALATAVVIIRVAIYPSRIMERGLSFRPLVWVGVISYGLYLWHVPIWVGMNSGWPVEVQDIGVLGAAGIAMLLTFLVAAASYRYAERPFLRMKVRAGRAQAVSLPAGAIAEPG